MNKTKTSKKIAPFIKKLSTILEVHYYRDYMTYIKDPKYNDVIRWSSDGLSVEIIDRWRMENEVLPIFYRHSKIYSFIRQLNKHGFKRSTIITQIPTFYHDMFRRDDM